MFISTKSGIADHGGVWNKGGKVNEVPSAFGAGTGCVLEALLQMEQGRRVPFVVGAGTVYCTKQTHKAYTNDLGKGPRNEYYCQWC